MKAKSFTISLLALAAVGCASDPPPKPPEPDQERLTSIHVIRDSGYQTTDQRPQGIAGAGINQGGYVHVLHDEPSNAGVDIAEPVASTQPADLGDQGGLEEDRQEKVSDDDPGHKASNDMKRAEKPVDKVRRAWERYCNAGEGMTDEDWEITNTTKMPEDLRKRCLPPK